MSTKYQNSADVPTEILAARLNELADVVAQKRDRIGAEFTMRIPAECDRDADLVMSEAARRLEQAQAVPEILYDGTTVFQEVKRKREESGSEEVISLHMTVSDVLDAVVRLMKQEGSGDE